MEHGALQRSVLDSGNEFVWREFAGLTLSESAYPARLRQPRHAHEPASFSLVLGGGYAETFGRRRFECRPATVVFRRPDESHAVAFGDAEARIFRLDLGPAWLARLCAAPAPTPETAELNGDGACHLAVRLYREFRWADEFSPLAVEGLALELWAAASRRAGRARLTPEPPRWLERARESLHARPAQAPTLSAMAREAGVHPAHLAHEFRRFYGTTAGGYLRRLRVERAATLVARRDLPLTEVAAAAGFYDQSHFTNAFKRATGLTPAQYRAIFAAPQSLPTRPKSFQDSGRRPV
jgi:AraC family transcriptional regulator